ncbi:MAG: hypothetical protein C4523_12330 [Myxococcales bacterium]|nr:MAG: hypothetical protein C4523_12330 [Myxococcales bacterium]
MPLHTTSYVVLFCFVLGALTPAWAQAESDDADTRPTTESDDEDVLPPAQSEREARTAEMNSDVLRVGLLDIRPTFEAENLVSMAERQQATLGLLQITQEINVQKSLAIPQESIMKTLGLAEKAAFQKCWVDPACLTLALKPANLDIVVATKLRVVEINPTELTDNEGNPLELGPADSQGGKKQIFADYSLFIRLIDLKNHRILREILLNHTDYAQLIDQTRTKYRAALKEMGLIVDRPEGMAKPDSGPDDVDALYKAPVSTHDPKLGLKIGAYTTLGMAVLTGAAGIAFGVLSDKAKDDAGNAVTIASLEDSDSKRRTYMITSNVMYGLAGAFAVTSIVLFVLGYQNSDQFASTGGVMVTPDGAMFNAQLTF